MKEMVNRIIAFMYISLFFSVLVSLPRGTLGLSVNFDCVIPGHTYSFVFKHIATESTQSYKIYA